jgi:hypothetical protein
MVMIGRINFEDEALIKRWQVGKKMDMTNEKWKNEKNEIIIESCFRLLLEIVSVFEVLKFTTTWMKKVQLKNYKK